MARVDGTPTIISPEQIYSAIADVLDPELDEPLLSLGFIDQVQVEGPDVMISFKLPTYFCAPNFAYLMAADLRDAAARVPGVRQVRVALLENCMDNEVSDAVNNGRSFAEAFPGETTEDAHLEELRRTFLRKGFLKRQDTLLRQMLKVGLDEATIADLRVADLRVDATSDRVLVRVAGAEQELERVVKSARAYQQRRIALGLPSEPTDALIIDDEGRPLQPGGLREFMRHSRGVRMNIMFNTALCKGLFQARYGGQVAPDDEEE